MLFLDPLEVIRVANAIAAGQGKKLSDFVTQKGALIQQCISPSPLDSDTYSWISKMKMQKWDVSEENCLDILEGIINLSTTERSVSVVLKKHYVDDMTPKKMKEKFLLETPNAQGELFDKQIREKIIQENLTLKSRLTLQDGVQRMMKKENGIDQFMTGKLVGMIQSFKKEEGGELDAVTMGAKLSDMKVKLKIICQENSSPSSYFEQGVWTIEGFKLEVKKLEARDKKSNHNQKQNSGQHPASHHQSFGLNPSHHSHSGPHPVSHHPPILLNPSHPQQEEKPSKRGGVRIRRGKRKDSDFEGPKKKSRAMSKFGTGGGMGPSSDEDELYYN